MIEPGRRTKATMCPIINKIIKLRSYRQEAFGSIFKSLITKHMVFWI